MRRGSGSVGRVSPHFQGCVARPRTSAGGVSQPLRAHTRLTARPLKVPLAPRQGPRPPVWRVTSTVSWLPWPARRCSNALTPASATPSASASSWAVSPRGTVCFSPLYSAHHVGVCLFPTPTCCPSRGLRLCPQRPALNRCQCLSEESVEGGTERREAGEDLGLGLQDEIGRAHV